MSASTVAAPAAPAIAALPRTPAVLAAAPVPKTSGAHGWDKTYFLDVNHFARETGWLHGFMLAYAVDGAIALFAFFLLIGWWFARRRRSPWVTGASLWAAVGTVIAVGVAQPINHAVAEARPWESLPHALILAGHTTDFSFPSDHATMAGAATSGILLYNRRLGVVALLAGLLLCFGRVYIGAHYPQDVIAGLLLGALVMLISYGIVRIPLARLVALVSRTPLRVLLTTGPALPNPTGAHRARDGRSARGTSATRGARFP